MRWAVWALVAGALAGGPVAADAIGDGQACYYAVQGMIEPEQAIPICTRAIESGELSRQNLILTYANRGVVYQMMDQFEPAVADFGRALALDPDDAITYYNRGNSYRGRGQYGRAIDDYSRTIALDPDNANAHNNRGNLYRVLGQYQRAIADQNEVLRIDPNNVFAHNNRGNTYATMGRFDRAIQDYDRALALAPGAADIHVNRGAAHAGRGRYGLALADFEAALRFQPESLRALRELARLRATAADAEYRDGPAAVGHATRAVAVDDGPAFRDTLAAAYAEAGRYADAVREQEVAIAQLQAIGRDDKLADYRARLALYRQGQPYRE